MKQLVECVPNFSEGKDPELLAQISADISSVRGVAVLDQHMDADHNRSVITFAGSPAAVEEAAFCATAKAAQLIDLTHHKGEHPRLGATDVVPFIPISGVTMDDCVAIARRVAQRIAEVLNIPTYLYERAATRPDRVRLENIRGGGFERLRAEIETNPNRAPDFGPPRLHPTAGATIVGARHFLIAFNINLNSSDIALAKEIAQSIRASSGGLPCLKAMGVMLAGRNLAQVTMNLTDFEKTSLRVVFEAVKQKAAARGVTIHSSEIVGLVPEKALEGIAPAELKLANFSSDKILENKIRQIAL